MTRRRKIAVVAAGSGVALLAVGLGSAGAIATSRMLSANDESKAVIDDAASQLGVQPEELSNALKQALKNQIDDAVDAGKLTKEQGKALKERIDSDDYPLLFGRGGPRHGLGFGFGHMHKGGSAVFETAAAYLGMSEADLREALRDQTLAEIAKKKGKSVDGLVKAIVATDENKIDEAVADGRITKAQATELKSRLTEHAEDLVNGEFRHRFGSRPGLWSGPGAPRGPPGSFWGPRA